MLKFPSNRYTGLQTSRYREQENVIAVAKINGGQITSVEAADLEDNQFTDIKNFVVRLDRTSRRFGSVLYTPAKPNSNKILNTAPWERFDRSVLLVRMTPSTIHLGSSTVWTNVVGVLTGGANDRFTPTITNDRFFFTNNGADYIQEINAAAFTFARLGNAPRYRYATSFNNRVVGANEYDAVTPNPIKIGWCGNLNFPQWDPATDQSAGFVSLVDSPTNFSDDITGIFGFSETALLLRERSLWGINKSPSATNPFTFFAIAPGIGCDSPYSAANIRNGIAWFDYRTRTVYAYKIGMQEPEPIGRMVDRSIQVDVDDKTTLFSSYNPIEDEYTLCIPHKSSTLVTAWTYNFRTKAWWNEEQSNVTSLSAIDFSGGTLMIDDLTGVINDLVGVIDDLTVNVAIPSRFYGKLTGEILVENLTADQDNAVVFNSELTSKIYSVPKDDEYVQTLRIEFIPRVAGSFTVYFSKDGGATWTAYKTATWTTPEIGTRKLVKFKKHIRAGQYAWRLTATSGLFDLIEYELKSVTSTGETHSR